MRGPLPAALLTAAAAALAAPAAADPPRLVDHTEWVVYQGWADGGALTSLRVFPTAEARSAARRLDGDLRADPLAARAWREVLVNAPDADTPGMHEQFLCHWRFAELAHPGKASWNLEPWRPVVDHLTMLGAGCNPGGPEEAL